jgi:hypothetical protein
MNYLHIHVHPKRGSRTLFNQGRGRIAVIKKKSTSTPIDSSNTPPPPREIHACFIPNIENPIFGRGMSTASPLSGESYIHFHRLKKNRGWGQSFLFPD